MLIKKLKDPKNRIIQLGIWTVITADSASTFHKVIKFCSNLLNLLISVLWIILCQDRKSFEQLRSRLPNYTHDVTYIWMFIKEVHSLGPFYVYASALLSSWTVIESFLSLSLTTRLLDLLRLSLEDIDERRNIILCLLGMLATMLLQSLVFVLDKNVETVIKGRIKLHFESKIMQRSLQFDLITSEDPEVRSKVESFSKLSDDELWITFELIRDFMFRILSILSTIGFSLEFSSRDPSFQLAVAASLLNPALRFLYTYFTYPPHYVAFTSNPHYLRLKAFHKIAFGDKFKEDILNNSCESYIQKEFQNSMEALGDVCTEDAYLQFFYKNYFWKTILHSLSNDLSLVIFALRVLWDASTVSIASLVLSQQISHAITSKTRYLMYDLQEGPRKLKHLQTYYSIFEINNIIKDGDVNFPTVSSKEEDTGVGIEFRNVSFVYPGTSKKALDDVSFIIKPGQLVVIVGVNGSGKSSTIKLLSRLYEPSEGQILFDGLSIQEYKISEVRRISSVLLQDHPILPLSIRDNIAIGSSSRNVSDPELNEAIRRGGSGKFIHKLNSGVETVLEPVKTINTYFGDESHPSLKDEVSDIEKKTSISGGESQRLAASRTFLRLMDPEIRLLVADEPTSALDPEGEYELFSKIREYGEGRTSIFITHRFGHLTRHADLILCLKDGKLVEQGTHESLLTHDGEYRKLYDVQAKAFIG